MNELHPIQVGGGESTNTLSCFMMGITRWSSTPPMGGGDVMETEYAPAVTVAEINIGFIRMVTIWDRYIIFYVEKLLILFFD